jgi:hypothetical protein
MGVPRSAYGATALGLALAGTWLFSPWEHLSGADGTPPQPVNGVPAHGADRIRDAEDPVLVAGALVERHNGGVRAVNLRTGKTWWGINRPGRVHVNRVDRVDARPVVRGGHLRRGFRPKNMVEGGIAQLPDAVPRRASSAHRAVLVAGCLLSRWPSLLRRHRDVRLRLQHAPGQLYRPATTRLRPRPRWPAHPDRGSRTLASEPPPVAVPGDRYTDGPASMAPQADAEVRRTRGHRRPGPRRHE